MIISQKEYLEKYSLGNFLLNLMLISYYYIFRLGFFVLVCILQYQFIEISDYECLFSSVKSGFGWPTYIDWNELTDPENGYLKDDTVKFRVIFTDKFIKIVLL